MAAVTNDRDLSVLWGKLEMTNGDMRGLLGEWLHPQREGVSAVYLRLVFVLVWSHFSQGSLTKAGFLDSATGQLGVALSGIHTHKFV